MGRASEDDGVTEDPEEGIMETTSKPDRYGCDDCGGTWRTKSAVPVECRPYTDRIVRDDTCWTGYTWDTSSDGNPWG